MTHFDDDFEEVIPFIHGQEDPLPCDIEPITEDVDGDDEEFDDEDDHDFVPGEDMDGDHDSSMASAGMGTDEDYGFYGNDE